jgi:hypothetical protein
MKNFTNQFRIIALVAVIGFAMTACPTDGGDGGGANVPGVNQLPVFPAGSNPATTKAGAEAVLAKLRQTKIIESLEDEMSDVIYENRGNSGDRDNYSFSNKSLPNGYVKVSASRTINSTSTGGFKAMNDLSDDDYEEKFASIKFASNDKTSITWAQTRKYSVTKDKAASGVTMGEKDIRF